jgi:hypothetical protein
MKRENQEKPTGKRKELFVKQLTRNEGNQGVTHSVMELGPFTTLSLGEESGK